MKRRFVRRKRSRKVFRKRIIRKRNFRKGSKYDGNVCAACRITGPMDMSANGHADIVVNWGGSTIAADGTLTLLVGNTAEYGNLAKLYQEYRVVGVKIKVIPIQQISNYGDNVGITGTTYGETATYLD